MPSSVTFKTDDVCEAPSTAQLAAYPGLPAIEQAEGCWFIAENGRKFFDATSGSGAISLGHGHPRVVEAAVSQVRRLCQTGSMIHAEVRDRMVRRLGAFSPFESCSVLLAVTGAEAVEAALKVARGHTKRSLVVCFSYAYHGKTTAALSVTWRNRFKLYSPIRADLVRQCRWPVTHSSDPRDGEEACLEAFARTLADLSAEGELPAAVILEPIAVTEGMLIPGEAFLKSVVEIARAAGSLVIYDEIWTGFGRSGTPFYASRPGLRPDLLVLGKGLANGFPISAVIGEQPVMEALPSGLHTSTFAGHPVACAAACAVLDEMEEAEPWYRTAEAGTALLRRLRAIEERSWIVSSLRGEGTMLAFECLDRDGNPSPDLAATFSVTAMRNDVIFHTGGYQGATIKVAPPPCISDEEIGFLTGIIAEVIDEMQVDLQ